MARQSQKVLFLLLLSVAIPTEYAFARPAPEVGARASGSRITAGGSHSCTIEEDSTVTCWGSNGDGQLGDGTTTTRLTPVAVSGLSTAVAISASVFVGDVGDDIKVHTCALLADGSARCWGFNAGTLGDGTTTLFTLTPVAVSGLSHAVAISAGKFHTCALLADGSAHCWGFNSNGQLGDSTTTLRLTQVAVVGLSGSISARGVAAGGVHSCARRANGVEACWGANGTGQIGDSTTITRLNPTQVSGLTNVTQASAGAAHSCALLADGTARCWGANPNGQLGDGTTVTRLTSVPVSGLSNVLSISTGSGSHTCALRADGTAHCWGFNGSGQLGDGTTANRTTPVPVSGLANTVAVSAGGGFSCGLVASGHVFCWGFNGSGQLGNGTTTTSPVPVQVSGISDAVAISAGNNHACALRANGTIRCWGSNAAGQVGDGTATNRSTPVQVSGISTAVAIVGSGSQHTCAVLVNGTARCWGRNDLGQLGDGTTTNRSTPVAVTGPSNVVEIAAGGNHTCALAVQGQPFCWGLNTSGQIGDGTTTNRLVATQVLSFTFNLDPNVTIRPNGKKARVFALANCEAGARVHILVELHQGTVVGEGHAGGECTSALERYPVRVHARGNEHFVAGAAQADAVAEVRKRGNTLEEQAWSRNVIISVSTAGGDDEDE